MTTSNFLNWSSIHAEGLTMRANKMKTNTLAFIFIIFACFISISSAKAQVTIGSGEAPEGGAVLDMKEFVAGASNETSNKGILNPRVLLTERNELYPMYWDAVAGAETAAYTANKADLKKKHIGLTIFNVTTNAYFAPGLYFWSGIEWRRMDDSPAAEASITDLLCGSATMSPGSYSNGVSFSGIVKVPYIGGTGGAYEGTMPVAGPNGLFIERIGGKLNYGSGEVMYRVTGTPTVSSPATTTFPIAFLGKACSITVGSGVSSVNLKNLTNDILVNTPYSPVSENVSNELTFVGGDIIIQEAGSYAFSLRLYGRLGQEGGARWPFYIYLQKNNKTTIVDAAEIDLVTVDSKGFPDFSYSITLGGVYEVGDKVIISMCKPTTGPSWTLKRGTSSNSNVRTSLIYWKL